MPTCVICERAIRLRGDEFYGAHIACAKTAVEAGHQDPCLRDWAFYDKEK